MCKDVNGMQVVDLMELRSIADRELTKLEGDARVLRLMYPRWLLLKGNSLQLSGRTTAAYTAFNQVSIGPYYFRIKINIS